MLHALNTLKITSVSIFSISRRDDHCCVLVYVCVCSSVCVIICIFDCMDASFCTLVCAFANHYNHSIRDKHTNTHAHTHARWHYGFGCIHQKILAKIRPKCWESHISSGFRTHFDYIHTYNDADGSTHTMFVCTLYMALQYFIIHDSLSLSPFFSFSYSFTTMEFFVYSQFDRTHTCINLILLSYRHIRKANFSSVHRFFISKILDFRFTRFRLSPFAFKSKISNVARTNIHFSLKYRM